MTAHRLPDANTIYPNWRADADWARQGHARLFIKPAQPVQPNGDSWWMHVDRSQWPSVVKARFPNG